MIQNEFITLSLQQFGQILRVPFNGQAVFPNEWGLGALAYSQETKGPYLTDLPTPEEIHQFLQFQRVDPNRKIKHKNTRRTPATPKAHLPFDMFLTCLFRHVMEHYPHLDNGIYNVVDHVMRPIALRQTRRPRMIAAKPITPSHQHPPITTLDLHLAKKMMMRMMVLLVLVPHLLPPT
ncbi:hypothetical protein Tco_1173693 [Tanacetum coccineum]